MSRPQLVSLFSGYGGLDMGIEAVYGSELVAVADIDKGANLILAHRYPNVPNLGDVSRIDWTEFYNAHLDPARPIIVSGGFPCQDLSHAGKRAGLKPGTRSGLWGELLRVTNELRPDLMVAENVRGLLSGPTAGSDVEPCPWCVGDTPEPYDMRALGVVLSDLASIGYDAQWLGLRAADVGAPHGRFRVFITAHPTADSGRVGLERPRPSWDGRPRPTDGDRRAVALLPTPTARDHKGENQRRDDTCLPGAVRRLLPTPAVNDMGAGKTLEWWNDWTAAQKAKHGNGNGHGPSLAIEALRHTQDWGVYADAIHLWEEVFRPVPAPTVPGRNGPRLSPVFVEWLQGLPAGHVTDVPGLGHAAQLKALGNGVVPQQSAAALARLAQALEAS